MLLSRRKLLQGIVALGVIAGVDVAWVAPALAGPLSIVQFSQGIHLSEIPGHVTLGLAPTPGNLLIAVLGVNENSYTPDGWTQFDAVKDDYILSGVFNLVCLYHYVVGGDTAVLPAFMSAGTTYWTHSVYEVAGVSGTWDTDFVTGIQLPWTSSNAVQPTIKVQSNGSLALSFVASYNASVAPTLSGSWTLDAANVNHTNYGSAGMASRSMNAGDTIDGTWTQGSSTPFGGYMMILGTPPVFPYVHRICSVEASNGTPGVFTLPFTPRVGNLLLAFLNWSDGTVASPTIGVGWTEWESASGGTGKQIIGLRRYVQGGNTATLPAFCSAGSTFNSIEIVEMGGVSGTWASDFISSKSGWQASGATLTTTSDTTTANNQTALCAYCNFDGNTLGAQSGFEGFVVNGYNFANYGSWTVAKKDYASSGSSVQGTMTATAASHGQAYIQAIFQGGSPPPPPIGPHNSLMTTGVG